MKLFLFAILLMASIFCCGVLGGYTSWSSWTCTVTCDGGTYQRLRKCKTLSCAGDLVHRSTVKCGTTTCPPPTLAPSVMHYVKKNLMETAFNKEIKLGTDETLTCDENAVTLIQEPFPNAKLQWFGNGKLLTTGDMSLDLKSVIFEDSGVYVCQVEYREGFVQPVKAIAVTVVDVKPLHTVTVGNDLTVTCNGFALGKLFRNLHQVWLLKDNVIKDYEMASPELVNVETFYEVTTEMEGEWKCVINEMFSDRKWITSKFTVKVEPAPKVFSRMLGDLATIITTITVGVVILCCILCTFFIKKSGDAETHRVDAGAEYQRIPTTNEETL